MCDKRGFDHFHSYLPLFEPEKYKNQATSLNK